MDVVMPVYLNPAESGQVEPDLVESTRRCIRNLKEHADASPVIRIVENGGANLHDYPDILDETKWYLPWDTNQGIARAWNAGMNSCTSDVVLIVNNDCQVITDHWDSYAMEYFTAIRKCAMLFPNEQGVIWNSPEPRYFGAFFFVLRSAWEEVGGCAIPPNPGGQYEDTYLFRKLERAGYQAASSRLITVQHEGRKTIRRMPGWMEKIEENRQWYENLMKEMGDEDPEAVQKE